MLCVCVSILPLSYELIQKPDENQMTDVSRKPYYYVWDTVAIALHVERGQVLSPPPLYSRCLCVIKCSVYL